MGIELEEMNEAEPEVVLDLGLANSLNLFGLLAWGDDSSGWLMMAGELLGGDMCVSMVLNAAGLVERTVSESVSLAAGGGGDDLRSSEGSELRQYWKLLYSPSGLVLVSPLPSSFVGLLSVAAVGCGLLVTSVLVSIALDSSSCSSGSWNVAMK